MHPCCRGHAVLHDSYTLLHVMRCILAGAMLFFTIATPFYMSCYASLLQGPCYTSGRDPWQNVSTLLLTMNLLKNTWEIHRRDKLSINFSTGAGFLPSTVVVVVPPWTANARRFLRTSRIESSWPPWRWWRVWPWPRRCSPRRAVSSK